MLHVKMQWGGARETNNFFGPNFLNKSRPSGVNSQQTRSNVSKYITNLPL